MEEKKKYLTHNWSAILCALGCASLCLILSVVSSPLWIILAAGLLRCLYLEDLGIFLDTENDRLFFPGGGAAGLKPRDIFQAFKRKEVKISEIRSVTTMKRSAVYLNRANAVCLSGDFGELRIFCDSETAAKAFADAISSEIKSDVAQSLDSKHD